MKNFIKDLCISLLIFVVSALLSQYVLSKPLAVLYDKTFHPNYGWWGSPLFVTLPASYEFLIVFLFTLWNDKKYYYMLIFLLPFAVLFISTPIRLNVVTFFVAPALVGFMLAKFIRLLISKFKQPNQLKNS